MNQKSLDFLQKETSAGYQDAIQYYEKKKKLFSNIGKEDNNLNEFIENARDEVLKELNNFQYINFKSINDFLENISDNTIKQIVTQKEKDKKQKFNSLENIIENYQEVKNYQKKIENINSSQAQQFQPWIEAKEKEIDNLLFDIYENFEFNSIMNNAINQLFKNNFTSQELNSIENFFTGFIRTQIKYYYMSNSNIYINKNNITTLMGYIKELIEYKVAQKVVQNSNKDGAVSLIAGKNTITDIQITIGGNDFMAQVKTKSLSQKIYNYKITNKSNLLASFKTEQNQIDIFDSEINNNWFKGIIFLGKETQIKKVFGENTFFINGNNWQFVSDFITDFRNQNMFLSFGYNKSTKTLTKQIELQKLTTRTRLLRSIK